MAAERKFVVALYSSKVLFRQAIPYSLCVSANHQLAAVQKARELLLPDVDLSAVSKIRVWETD